MKAENFKTKFIAALVTASCFWGGPTLAQGLLDDFEILFERCRVSVETLTAFDTEGLQETSVAEGQIRDWGIASKQEAWKHSDSELYVVLTQWTSRDEVTRHLCDVSLADGKRSLDAVEQALLLRHFLVKQVQLIGAGTHEIDRRLSSVPPLVNGAFLLSERNPNGCKVTNTIAFSPDGTFFSAGSGEQAIVSCDAE